MFQSNHQVNQSPLILLTWNRTQLGEGLELESRDEGQQKVKVYSWHDSQ